MYMSLFGEIAEHILEITNEEKITGQDQLKKRIPESDLKILDFMTEFGLLELKDGHIIIGELGSALLIVERLP